MRCGLPAVTVDHIKAVAFGGTNDPGNLASLCQWHADRKNTAEAAEDRRLKRAAVAAASRPRHPGLLW